ncbi:hypothetical protein CDN99_19005 [Roseateles aquatilis]|uniref:Cytochrome n=1 Tax=Roseateles aquatilis TaxID=431061 RepID=A0A246J2J5_9BURK|nr:hypothetical protein [Roseateles aquatilis]OWQ86809.1 hypothetical protein CDN99_19005 [Roseateles aquatilis]
MTACPFQGAAAAPPALSPLQDPDLRMRPPGEPLPAPLRAHGGALADVFARWLRQRDDDAHAAEKCFLTRALQALSDDDIRSHARRQAAIAWAGDWPHWSWAVPAATVASLLGLPIDDLAAQQRLHAALRTMAGGLSAAADGDAVRAAGTAVEHLLQALDEAERRSPDAPLQWTLLRHAPPARWSDRATFAANRLALIWQSHEAGASLLGHALLAMKTGGGAPTREALWHIARDGGAVRDTRRFDRREPVGAPVVVPLAGTDHPFGDGAHRCPGQGLTLATLHAALGWLAQQPGLRLPDVDTPLSLPNMDIPRFHPARVIDQETQP